MLKFVKSSVAIAGLAGIGLMTPAMMTPAMMTPAMAQDASEMALRVQQLEEQVRQLSGQVEELTFEMGKLRGQSEQGNSGAAEQLQAPPAAAIQQKRLADASAPLPDSGSDGMAVVEQQSVEDDLAMDQAPAIRKAPAPQVLGAMDNASAQPNDGGFQGKVLVPPSQQEAGDDSFLQQNSLASQPSDGSGDAIETVALAPESPESLYERSNESLLRRQFGDAESGFSTFLSKYPDHSLAGSAQYWLGETFYAQRDYKRAAQSFLQGYKKYPKSRRAPESLLKLGISLKQLGQSDQACAAYAAVNAEYPKAVDARKRAQAEARRADCAA